MMTNRGWSAWAKLDREKLDEDKEMKDTGVKMLKRAKEFNFLKWGEYMKRAQLAERKLEKLKALILLVDESVGDIEMNDLTKRQWLEFIKCFPDEGDL